MAIQEIWAGAAAWNQRSIKTLLELGLHPIEADETLNGESDTSQAIRTFSVSRDGWLRASNDDAI
jgi:hypothetical protein